MSQIPDWTEGDGGHGLVENIRYSITNTCLKEKRVKPLNRFNGFCEFSFFVDGCLSFQVQGHRRKLHASRLQSHFAINNGVDGVVEFSYERPLRWLTIHIPRVCLSRLIETQSDGVTSTWLTDLMEDDNRKFYCHIDALTNQMQSAVAQVCACPNKSIANTLFAKAKALELISLKLSQISNSEDKSRMKVCPHDEALMIKAANLLTSDLACPPALDELAKAIGISRTRLVSLFPMVLGETPYTFLRRARLSRAKNLLEVEGKNVSEAAWSVGYSEISPFHRAFVKEFGIKPGDCRRGLSMGETLSSVVTTG